MRKRGDLVVLYAVNRLERFRSLRYRDIFALPTKLGCEGSCPYMGWAHRHGSVFNLETAVGRGAACVLFVAWQGTTTSERDYCEGEAGKEKVLWTFFPPNGRTGTVRPGPNGEARLRSLSV